MKAIDLINFELEILEESAKQSRLVIELGKDLNEIIDWSNTDDTFIKKTVKYRAMKAPPIEQVDCSLLVIAWGTFEKFLKQSLVDTANKLTGSENAKPSPKLLRKHTELTGKAIIGSIQKPHRYEMTAEDLSANLVTTLDKSDQIRLNTEALAFIDFNLNSDSILNYYKRVDVELDWDAIGNHSELKKLLKESSKKSASRQAQVLVDWIYKKRNLIAHTGGIGATLDSYEIEFLISFIKHLSKAISDALTTNIAKKISA
jgi:hypothetical protein